MSLPTVAALLRFAVTISALASLPMPPAAPATAASESLRAREERAFFEGVCFERRDELMSMGAFLS